MRPVLWGLTSIQLIGLLRLIPIMTIFSMTIYRKHIMLTIWSGSFVIATIANAFYQNQFVAGTFSSISAYAAAYVVIPYLTHHYKKHNALTNKKQKPTLSVRGVKHGNVR